MWDTTFAIHSHAGFCKDYATVSYTRRGDLALRRRRDERRVLGRVALGLRTAAAHQGPSQLHLEEAGAEPHRYMTSPTNPNPSPSPIR